MHARGNAWLSEGVGYIRNDECPFCGQSLAAAKTLISAYNAYFSAAFNGLRDEIAVLRKNIETSLGDREIAQFEKVFDQNAGHIDFWKRYSDISAPSPIEGSGDSLRALRESALALLDRKTASPLDSVDVDAEFIAHQNNVAAVQQSTATYNEVVRAANSIINAKKTTTASADVKAVEAALAKLGAAKRRHEPEVKALCQSYETLQTEKTAIEAEKAAVRLKLDDYTKQVIGKYEQRINQLLEDFHAGFRITETKHGYPGGVASSTYQILINGIPVELGDSKTPHDKPSFKNTLSAGDKSVLALAFFLAQLDHDPDKASKIVIFDDPFNSQDSFRKDCTIQKIKKCGDMCKQVP